MKRFFHFLLGTKLGLFLLAGVVFGLSQAYSLPATDYIRHESTSTGTDVALRLVYFALMCLVAFSETLLVDELFFHGGWRKRVLGGHKGSLLEEFEEGRGNRTGEEGDEDGEGQDGEGREGEEASWEEGAEEDGAEEDDESVSESRKKGRNDADYSIKGSLFRDYTVHVTLAFLVLLAGNYYLFNAINGQFDSY